MNKSQAKYWLNRLGTQEPAVFGRVSEYGPKGKREYPIIVSRAKEQFKPKLMYVDSLDSLEPINMIWFEGGNGLPKRVSFSPEGYHPFKTLYELPYTTFVQLQVQSSQNTRERLEAKLEKIKI